MNTTISLKQIPSVGRAVHYQSYGTPGGEYKSEPRAATIVAVHDADLGDVTLFVMTPNGTFHNRTFFSEEPKPGHWNWPPRV